METIDVRLLDGAATGEITITSTSYDSHAALIFGTFSRAEQQHNTYATVTTISRLRVVIWLQFSLFLSFFSTGA